LISLATQNPPRSETALALLGVSARPESWLLAADLLQRDGRYAASVRVLAGLEARVPPQLAQVAALREGDALLATGDPVGAARAYEHAPEPIATVRRLHATLLQKKTTTWTQAIPELRRLARADDRGAAEALYLLSQIHRIFGENKSAMAVLNEIDTRFPAVFEDSEGTNELLAVYQSTLGPLVEQRRWVETAALHRETWSDRLMAASTDHRFLLPIADAFEALGLPEEARNVLRDAFYILNRREGDDPALVLRLAHLYADEGRQAEAMETLDYLASRDLPEAYRGQRAMLLGQVLASMGQDAEAKKAYASAALHPETRDEAQIRLALMDAAAGRCQDAIPSLQRLLLPERMLAHRTDPLPFLALARCLMSEGRESEAARVAREAAGRIDSPDDARAAGYMAFDPAGAEGEAAAMQREALLAEPDIWARLGLEDIENERFKEQVAARRGSLSAP
jgi:predicted negative regulator of RcsB-dependent stress response